jgi:HK97 family phage portal protein
VGILDQLRGAFSRPDAGNTVMLYGMPATFDDVRRLIQGQDPATIYRQQPNLRTLISFLARNIAQLGVHTYQRVGDTDRKRETKDPAAQTLARPNKTMTTYDLFFRLVADLALWDEALWLVTEDIESESGWTIQPIPMRWVVKFKGGDLWGPQSVEVLPPGAAQPTTISMDEVIHFHGWDPDNLHRGVSPVEALKATISEQIHAAVYREQQWTKGGRVGMVVSRPKDAPSWTADQKRKFKEILDAKLAGDNGSDAGGSIIFEDGMDGKRLGFSAKEDQFVEAAKLSFTTVCQVYHVNPTMVGLLDNANFSNVKEFRRMLYGETLGPTLVQLEDRLNSFLLPRIASKSNLYYEFNVKEKLRGSFEEEAQFLQAAVGGPYMARNEARARQNLPAIEGGDELIVPLNVVEGGQASPQDSTPDSITGESSHPGVAGKLVDLGEVRAIKARASATAQANTEKALKAYFKRQRAVVLSALGAKVGDEWWDEDRWNSELAADLYKIAVQIAHNVGRKTAEELGFDPGVYDTERTVKFLQAVALSRAGAINGATKAALDRVLTSDDEEGPKPADVFTEAEEVRSVAGAAALVTCFAAFATTEAAKQVSSDDNKATKTWVVTSANPRKAHAKMNGETVPVDEKFSNGADWPGDPVLGSDGVAGCMCSVTVRMPE